MRLLVLGGTRFVGKHIVLEALQRGHTVSTFTRGVGQDDLPGEVERLHGDRDGQLGALQGRTWDAAIDVSGYLPRVVRQSAELLRDAVGRYLFISTISVYAEPYQDGGTEDAPLAALSELGTEEITGETYGPLKVECERVVRELYGERATILRPGLIVGPFDPTDRFTFWAHGLARREAFPIFGNPDSPLQVIDARDLAVFTLHLLETGQAGTFHGVGEQWRWQDLVDGVREATGQVPQPVWLDEGAQEASGLELPLGGPAWGSLMRLSAERAVGSGLTRRPLAETVRDLLAWVDATGREVNPFGLTEERRRELVG